MLLFLIIFIISIGIIFVFSEISLNIVNYQYLNNKNDNNGLKLCVEPNKIKLQFYFLGKIKWASFNVLDNKKKEKYIKDVLKQRILTIRKKNKQLDKKQRKRINKFKKYIIKKLIKNSKIKKINLQIILDTNDVELTSLLIGIISILIPNLLKNSINKYNSKDYNFKILPLYKSTNYIYFKLNCIISIKVLHIIDILKGGYTDERTSNRKFNVNCYGKH